MGDLLDLAVRVEAAEGPDRELDAWIAVALGAWPNTLEAEQSTVDASHWSVVEREPDGTTVDRFSPKPFTASLDAAMTLAEGYGGSFTFFRDGTAKAFLWNPYPLAIEVKAATLALALTAAALRARATK